MKKILSLILGITLLMNTCLGSAVYAIDINDSINYNDINSIAELFDRIDDVEIYTADGITCETKEIINNDKYKIVGTKSYRKISIAVYNKQTKKLDVYDKNLLMSSNSLTSNNAFTKLDTIDLANTADISLSASRGDTINTYTCNYLNYKYAERWPSGPASDINVKFTLTKPSQSCMTNYVLKTSDIYKYSKKFETHIKYADANMKNGFEVGLGFIPGVGQASAVISIVETAKNFTLENFIVALKGSSELIPFWGQIISLSDMASQFLLANANCISANSDYKRVYDLCN